MGGGVAYKSPTGQLALVAWLVDAFGRLIGPLFLAPPSHTLGWGGGRAAILQSPTHLGGNGGWAKLVPRGLCGLSYDTQ